MYDERIESLIKAALADGELTEKEKQILFKNAAEQGIDLDEFEMVLESRLVEMKKAEQQEAEKMKMEQARMAAQAKPATPKSNKFGDIRKCPNCGAILQSFQTKCAECGYEFKNVSSVESAGKLFDLLQAANLRNASLEEKINIVKNFPVPNSKEDLLELLSMSTSNAYDNDSLVGIQEEAWIQKTDQVYKKIVVCAGSDQEFLLQATNMIVSLMKRLPKEYKKFTTIPPQMMSKVRGELDKQNKEEMKAKIDLLKGYSKWAVPCIIACIILIIIGLLTSIENGCAQFGIIGMVAVVYIVFKKYKKDSIF